jgi:hypothetical protein
MMLKEVNLPKTSLISSQSYWLTTKNSSSCQNSKASKSPLSQQNSRSALSINPLICPTKTYFKALQEEEKSSFRVVRAMLMVPLKALPQLILSSVPINQFLAQICNNRNSKLLGLVYSAVTVSDLIDIKEVKMKITILHK